jgi:hypothetical protein
MYAYDDNSYRCEKEEEYLCECIYSGTNKLGLCQWCYEEEERYEARRQREIKAEHKRKRKALLENFCLSHLRNIHGIDYVEEMLFAKWRRSHSSVLVVNGVDEAIWELDKARCVPKLKPILNYFLESREEVSINIRNYCSIQHRCRTILNQEALAELHPRCREILAIELQLPSSEELALRNFLNAATYTEEPLCVIKKLFEYVQTIGPYLVSNPDLLNGMVSKVAEFKANPLATSILDTLLAAEDFLQKVI